MKNALIILLGNRDIQISEGSRKELKGKYFEYFVKNNDADNFYVIDKSNNKKDRDKKTFLEISRIIWEERSYFKPFIRFELYEKTMEILRNENTLPDKIFITTSNQTPPHAQDCVYLALLLEEKLKTDGIPCEIHFCQENPTNLEVMVTFYTELFNKIQSLSENVIISNTGGTPVMRSASHFAGLFRRYRYIAINADDQKTSKVYVHQEMLVLKSIIKNMLDAYDYEGIINLPVGEEIKQLCKEALDLYNLKTDIIDEKANFGEKSRKAINLLLNNLEVCFAQGRYADVIGRIFRIEEAVGQMLVHDEACALGVINEDDKVQRTNSKGKVEYKNTFENTLANRNNSIDFYTQHFSDLFEEDELKNDWKFKHFPDIFLRQGKPFFFYFFRSLQKHTELYDFFEKLNDRYDFHKARLSHLRNRSYLGHGFRGVSKEDIEEITGEFQAFLKKLCELLVSEAAIDYSPIFKEMNERVEALL